MDLSEFRRMVIYTLLFLISVVTLFALHTDKGGVDMEDLLAEKERRALGIAKLALKEFKRDDAIIMVAIAGAESQFGEFLRGDSITSLRFQGLNVAADRVAAYNCEGAGSFGIWQIHIPIWKESLKNALSAPVASPCDFANWLNVPENNLRAAKYVYLTQGFTAWSTYQGVGFRAYLPMATKVVDLALDQSYKTKVTLGTVAAGIGAFLLWKK